MLRNEDYTQGVDTLNLKWKDKWESIANQQENGVVTLNLKGERQVENEISINFKTIIMDYIRGKCRYILAPKSDYTIDELNRGEFRFIKNIAIGGDEDYIVIDIVRKEWTHGESGTEPFYDAISLNRDYSQLDLNELTKWKYHK